jgi:signal transduction histidine kinase
LSTLLVTYDDDAGELLSAALRRAKVEVAWVEDLEEAQDLFAKLDPLVVVVDTGFAGFAGFVERVISERPWARVFLLEEPDAPVYRTGLPVLRKPFDVAELAPLLTREEEAGRLDRDRRRLERRTDQLVEREKDLTRELEHAERLAAIGRIAASMAHEINNPLAVVQSSSIYIREVAERVGHPELLECAADIELAVDRISTFVQHICGFARRERPQLSDVAVTQAVDIAMRLVAPRAKSRHTVVDIERTVPTPVPHDPPRLAQAILNLLSNAVDAAATGGKKVTLSVLQSGENLSITVDDSGPGISGDIVDRLFEPFATTKPHGQGTGLGLSITRQIMDDHGGRVSLRPHPDHPGTRAELILPILNTKRFPLLVIDHDALVQRALVNALRADGFPVEAQSDPHEAAMHVVTPPEVVIVDTPMAEDEGRAITSQMRELFPEARLLAIVDTHSACPAEADAHLTRPWGRPELLTAVRKLCLSVRPVAPV